MSDIRLVQRVGTLEEMKETGVKVSECEPYNPDDYPDEQEISALHFAHFEFGGAIGTTSTYTGAMEGIGIKPRNCMMLFYVELENPYEVEYAQHIQKFYDEAIEELGVRYAEPTGGKPYDEGEFRYMDDIIKFIRERRGADELRELSDKARKYTREHNLPPYERR